MKHTHTHTHTHTLHAATYALDSASYTWRSHFYWHPVLKAPNIVPRYIISDIEWMCVSTSIWNARYMLQALSACCYADVQQHPKHPPRYIISDVEWMRVLMPRKNTTLLLAPSFNKHIKFLLGTSSPTWSGCVFRRRHETHTTCCELSWLVVTKVEPPKREVQHLRHGMDVCFNADM